MNTRMNILAPQISEAFLDQLSEHIANFLLKKEPTPWSQLSYLVKLT
jgi:hypothetical protein